MTSRRGKTIYDDWEANETILASILAANSKREYQAIGPYTQGIHFCQGHCCGPTAIATNWKRVGQGARRSGLHGADRVYRLWLDDYGEQPDGIVFSLRNPHLGRLTVPPAHLFGVLQRIQWLPTQGRGLSAAKRTAWSTHPGRSSMDAIGSNINQWSSCN